MNYRMILFMDKRLIQRILFTVLWLGIIVSPAALLSQSGDAAFPPKPTPAVYVHDYSGWLSEQQKSALEYKLRRYWDSTSTQIVVMIRPDLGDYDRATYAIELGQRWGVGGEKKDNGVVILIKTEAPDRGVFIATGYGVEGGLTDLRSGQIIRNVMAPYFRQKQYYEGIDEGINAIFSALAGEFQSEPGDKASENAGPVIFMLIVFGLIFLFVFISMRRQRKGQWYTHNGGPRRYNDSGFPGGGPWWFGGGGGWGSGGGSSNDGGGWSGDDFGGGDFGGGGAGGDW